jgi:hypothetical protein
MSTTEQRSRYRLRVNAYDRASSLLVSLLIVSGLVVVGLLIVYFARRLISQSVSIPVTPVDVATRSADAAMGLKRDLEPPGVEDAPDLMEPKIEDTLSAVVNAISTKTALLSNEDIDASTETTQGKGLGDDRRAGLAGVGDRAGPQEPQREVRFEPGRLLEYAQWLDFFHIELGVLGQDNKIHYAYNLSKKVPDVRQGEPTDEKRLFMNSARGRFAALDRRLASRAGIATRGRIVLQFYPPEAQAILYELEQRTARAAGQTIEDIRRTAFRVTRNENQFEFQVEEQSYR